MPDPNPDILGKGIEYLLKKKIDVHFFDHDLSEKIRIENAEFISENEQIPETIKSDHTEFEGPSEKEKEPVKTATIDDFSIPVIKKYVQCCNSSIKIPLQNYGIFFIRRDLLFLMIKIIIYQQ